jgi:hypothetical protein
VRFTTIQTTAWTSAHRQEFELAALKAAPFVIIKRSWYSPPILKERGYQFVNTGCLRRTACDGCDFFGT